VEFVVARNPDIDSSLPFLVGIPLGSSQLTLKVRDVWPRTTKLVFTKARGREMIFWQSSRTVKQARPNVSLPTAQAPGGPIEIIVDSHERYAWNFGHQQATTVRQALPAGDYAVADENGAVIVEDRYSAIFKLTGVRPRVVADGIAELQVRYPAVPIVFCETRPLAQEWAYRYLGAALEHHRLDVGGALLAAELSEEPTAR
jgi:hypothetical protein